MMQRFCLFAAMLFAITSVGASTASEKARFANLLEFQPVTIRVELATPRDAQLAKIRPLPLCNGAEWAVTSRWDDNHWGHLKIRATLLEHGHRGTFFLIDPKRGAGGTDYGLVAKRSMSEFGRILTSGGTTVGSHSLTHPSLSRQNRNRIFEETLGCRIALEAAFDTLVNAYGFSYGNFLNSIEGVDVQRDIATMLARAGYLQVANYRFAQNDCWPWGAAAMLPADGQPIDRAFAAFLANKRLHNSNPAIPYSMHAWHRTPEDWAGFEADLDRYGKRPHWWYCNHNEYGSYRVQYRTAVRGTTETDGAVLRYHFQRPSLLDLNDPIPLTLVITGVEPDNVKSIECAGVKIDRTDMPDGTVRCNVPHPEGLRLPVRIDHAATPTGKLTASTDFPAIRGALAISGQSLVLRLENTLAAPMHIRRVVYRVPLRYRQGVIRRAGMTLSAGTPFTDRVELEQDRTDRRYRAGEYFFAAQIDFVFQGEPGRVYFTTRQAGSRDDDSYPQHGFSVLSPIPRAAIDLKTQSAEQLLKKHWTGPDSQRAEIKPVDPEVAKRLNVERIPVHRGRGVHLLRSRVHSPTTRQVRLVRNTSKVPAVWLNGQPVEASASCALQAGANDLLIAFVVGYSAKNEGPMFRISDAQTGQRLDDIRYQPAE